MKKQRILGLLLTTFFIGQAGAMQENNEPIEGECTGSVTPRGANVKENNGTIYKIEDNTPNAYPGNNVKFLGFNDGNKNVAYISEIIKPIILETNPISENVNTQPNVDIQEQAKKFQENLISSLRQTGDDFQNDENSVVQSIGKLLSKVTIKGKGFQNFLIQELQENTNSSVNNDNSQPVQVQENTIIFKDNNNQIEQVQEQIIRHNVVLQGDGMGTSRRISAATRHLPQNVTLPTEGQVPTLEYFQNTLTGMDVSQYLNNVQGYVLPLVNEGTCDTTGNNGYPVSLNTIHRDIAVIFWAHLNGAPYSSNAGTFQQNLRNRQFFDTRFQHGNRKKVCLWGAFGY